MWRLCAYSVFFAALLNALGVSLVSGPPTRNPTFWAQLGAWTAIVAPLCVGLAWGAMKLMGAAALSATRASAARQRDLLAGIENLSVREARALAEDLLSHTDRWQIQNEERPQSLTQLEDVGPETCEFLATTQRLSHTHADFEIAQQYYRMDSDWFIIGEDAALDTVLAIDLQTGQFAELNTGETPQRFPSLFHWILFQARLLDGV